MIPNNVVDIMKKLEENEFEAYIIGGAVRDILLEVTPKDYDIFTNATGEEILKIFPQGIVMGGDERQAKILTVIVDGIEVSQFRKNGYRTEVGNDLKTHCSTCDFTMNAIAMNVNEEKTDFFGGMSDINKSLIRAVGNAQLRFEEDYLRILRAIRFAVKYNFDIHRDTEMFMIYFADKLKSLPVERVREEMMKILKYEKGLNCLLYHKFFEEIIPELTNLHSVDAGPYHNEKNVLEHSTLAFKESLKLTDNPNIHLACLFHDLGKFVTKDTLEHGHEQHSEIITREIMGRLKFSNEEIKYVTTMVKYHMMGKIKDILDKTLVKMVNELENARISVEDMLIMRYCDNKANLKNPRIKFNEFYQENNWLRRVYKLKYQRMPFSIKDLAIDGHDVMAVGFSGPEIGKTLKILFEKVLEAKIQNERPYLLIELARMRL